MPPPPGLPPCASFTLATDGSADGYDTWRAFSVVKRFTNAFVWDPENKKVLLGFKKRGFGKGMYNGFGGKVDPGETVLEAGIRELKEEAGIDAPLEPCGVLFFVGEGGAFAHHITVFKATSFTGTISETDEMRPEWFAFPTPDPILNPDSASLPSNSDPDSSILPTPKSDLAPFPYHLMWKDDPLWVPLLLSHTPFIGRVDYGPIDGGQEKESDMQKWWVAAVEKQEFYEGKVWEV
ncbi:hypothetical protein FS749_007842 [Ceratobasidium sp. UAMH 11750]|nr:hypothetical protein FS749_007842 [Ceratobasidium sp. UAMH 11750]